MNIDLLRFMYGLNYLTLTSKSFEDLLKDNGLGRKTEILAIKQLVTKETTSKTPTIDKVTCGCLDNTEKNYQSQLLSYKLKQHFVFMFKH